jgi:DNA-binding transcriptional regulator/RsmH inhibitor MraZ
MAERTVKLALRNVAPAAKDGTAVESEWVWQLFFENKQYLTVDTSGRILLTPAGADALDNRK